MNLYKMVFTFNNILITGGCGFIGSNFINYIFNNYSNKRIINIDRLDISSDIKNVDIESNKENDYNFFKVDISNVDFIYHLLTFYNIDTIVHFAAQTHVDNSFCNSIQFVIDNVVGTNYLLEACRKYGNIQRFIHFSTDEVYGEIELNQSGCTEKSLLNPTNPYAASKAGAEFIVRSYYYSFKIPIIITRCNNAYGPNQYNDKLIPKFISHLLNNEKCTIHGDGKALRTFIHTNDISIAVDKIIQNGNINDVYNIGSMNEFNVMDIFYKLVSVLKSESQLADNWFVNVPDRNFNDMRYFVQTAELEKLGWKETTSFNDGFITTIKWYIKKQFKNDFENFTKDNLKQFLDTLDFSVLNCDLRLSLNIKDNISNEFLTMDFDNRLYYIQTNLLLLTIYEYCLE